MSDQDPAATFRLDQEAASQEQKTREETTWELNVRNGVAQAAQTEGVAAYWAAKASFWSALTNLAHFGLLIVISAGLWWVIAQLIGAFQ